MSLTKLNEPKGGLGQRDHEKERSQWMDNRSVGNTHCVWCISIELPGDNWNPIFGHARIREAMVRMESVVWDLVTACVNFFRVQRSYD